MSKDIHSIDNQKFIENKEEVNRKRLEETQEILRKIRERGREMERQAAEEGYYNYKDKDRQTRTAF